MQGVIAQNGTHPVVPKSKADTVFEQLLGYEADQADRSRERGIALCIVVPLMLVFLGLFLWEYFTPNRIEPMVQVAQVDAEGKIQLQGPPQALLVWTPPESSTHDMLTSWVRQFYWRPQDVATAKVMQHWVERHTCGAALKHLRVLQQREQVFKPTYQTVQIGGIAVQKTPAPRQYQVIWEQIEVYNNNEPKPQKYSAVFTVGRVKPTDKEWYAWNAAGLCVDGFSQKEAI